MNGYPLHLVQGVINKSWEKRDNKNNPQRTSIAWKWSKEDGALWYSACPIYSRFYRKLAKEVTQIQCWNGAQKRGHDKANYLSHKTKNPKDATKNRVYKFINLTAENVRAGTLVKKDREWRREHISTQMM